MSTGDDSGGDLVSMLNRVVSRVSLQAELYQSYGDDLVRFATGLVGPSDAQDAVSDAMTRLLVNSLLETAENPRALMYRAVFAAAKSMQRSAFRRRRREQATARSVVSHDPEVDPDVLAAVLRLSTQQRACVFLTYWHDLGANDVGQLLGIDPGTVKQHLFRARARLKGILHDD